MVTIDRSLEVSDTRGFITSLLDKWRKQNYLVSLREPQGGILLHLLVMVVCKRGPRGFINSRSARSIDKAVVKAVGLGNVAAITKKVEKMCVKIGPMVRNRGLSLDS